LCYCFLQMFPYNFIRHFDASASLKFICKRWLQLFFVGNVFNNAVLNSTVVLNDLLIVSNEL
jgi:hypothetical protein